MVRDALVGDCELVATGVEHADGDEVLETDTSALFALCELCRGALYSMQGCDSTYGLVELAQCWRWWLWLCCGVRWW